MGHTADASKPPISGVSPERLHLAYGNLVVGLMTLYPMLRFATEGWYTIVQFIALLYLASVAIAFGDLKRITLFLPLIAGFAVAGLYCYFQGSSEKANYFYLMSFYVFAIPALSTVKFAYSLSTTRILALALIALCAVFFFFPGIEGYGSEKYTESITDNFLVEEGIRNSTAIVATRFQAFFLHSNELGIFVAALLFILILVRNDNERASVKFLDLLIQGALILLVLTSNSLSAEFAIAVAYLLRFAPARWVLSLTYLTFFFLFITQFFFADAMVDLLETGSMAWRYEMANDIISQASVIGFSPMDIDSHAYWPHSIFLDCTFVAGLLGPFLLFGAVSIFSLFLVPPAIGAGVLTFFVCAALQPVGAMPVCFIFLAVAVLAGTTFSSSSRAPPNGRSAGLARAPA